MVFPISDDNTDRVRTPYITYLLILVNVLVFVFLQGLGTNERFTYAFSTIPEEIRTGVDIARPSGSRSATRAPRSRCSPRPEACTRRCWCRCSCTEASCICWGTCCFCGYSATTSKTICRTAGIWVLSRYRRDRVAGPCHQHVRVRRQPDDPEPGRLGRDFGRDGRLSGAAPSPPSARDHVAHVDRRAWIRGCRSVVRVPVDQRVRGDRARAAIGWRCGVHGAYRRVHRRRRAREGLRRREQAGRPPTPRFHV